MKENLSCKIITLSQIVFSSDLRRMNLTEITRIDLDQSGTMRLVAIRFSSI